MKGNTNKATSQRMNNEVIAVFLPPSPLRRWWTTAAWLEARWCTAARVGGATPTTPTVVASSPSTRATHHPTRRENLEPWWKRQEMSKWAYFNNFGEQICQKYEKPHNLNIKIGIPKRFHEENYLQVSPRFHAALINCPILGTPPEVEKARAPGWYMGEDRMPIWIEIIIVIIVLLPKYLHHFLHILIPQPDLTVSCSLP